MTDIMTLSFNSLWILNSEHRIMAIHSHLFYYLSISTSSPGWQSPETWHQVQWHKTAVKTDHQQAKVVFAGLCI